MSYYNGSARHPASQRGILHTRLAAVQFLAGDFGFRPSRVAAAKRTWMGPGGSGLRNLCNFGLVNVRRGLCLCGCAAILSRIDPRKHAGGRDTGKCEKK